MRESIGRSLSPRAILLLLVVSTLGLTGCSPAQVSPFFSPIRVEPTPTLTPLEILDGIRAEIVPPENAPTGYGIAFNYAGYQTMLIWYQEAMPSPSWADQYEAVDVALPCCRVVHPFRDESRNCPCGHHQALYGLSKYLLARGYAAADVQREVDRWKAYMFPREAVAAELERRALSDPAIRRALQELRERGEC